MTKPVTRKMAVDCLLERVATDLGMVDGVFRLFCGECGEPFFPGQAIQFDHVHADGLGGPHVYQNLRPIHYDPCHKKKNKRDVAALAKIDRITGVTGNRRRKPPMKSRGFGKQKRPFQQRAKP